MKDEIHRWRGNPLQHMVDTTCLRIPIRKRWFFLNRYLVASKISHFNLDSSCNTTKNVKQLCRITSGEFLLGVRIDEQKILLNIHICTHNRIEVGNTHLSLLEPAEKLISNILYFLPTVIKKVYSKLGKISFFEKWRSCGKSNLLIILIKCEKNSYLEIERSKLLAKWGFFFEN